MSDVDTYNQLLRFKVMRGLVEYGLDQQKQYVDRVDYELGVIKQCGFAGYFLIVADLCRFMRTAKPRPIRFLVRGSGCGSLCVYLLKISHRWLDPITLDLPFERFLNPARVSNPDLDIDIDDTRRHEVVTYTIEKYGSDRVARIATFGTLGAKAAIIDIARAQQVPDYQIVGAQISSLISSKPGTDLQTELASNEALRDQQRRFPMLFETALRVEGKARHASIHAAGTVILPHNIWRTMPTYWKGNPADRDESEQFPTTQWDMYDVEAAGVLKMDYLGLKTLRVIEHTQYLINLQRQARGEPPFDIDTIDRRDRKTWEMLARGELAGVFQVEKQFVRNFARRMNLTRMEPWDLAVLVAIIRPGMMDCGATEKFLRRASGQEQSVPIIPKLGEIGVLKHKYELFVFQEDCMLVAVKLAGFTMSEADELRRAIGKKLKDKIEKIRPKFIDGCISHSGVTAAEAELVWSQMETFARYGFNNAHAAAYGCVGAYQTAYLKAHYPLLYMTAIMNSEAGVSSKENGYNCKVAEYAEEARAMGITVSRPCVRQSIGMCRANVGENRIIFGMDLIKGASTKGVEWVMSNCRGATSFAEFLLNCFSVENTGKKRTRTEGGVTVETADDEWKHYVRVNTQTIESLIWSGALDIYMNNEAGDRPRMIAMLAGLMPLCESYHKAAAALRSGRNPKVPPHEWIARIRAYTVADSEIEQISMEELLDRERARTGCFLTYSPFEPFLHIHRERDLATPGDIADCEYTEVKAMVLLRSAREFVCKNGRSKGRNMLRMTLDGIGGTIECPIFPDDLDAIKARHILIEVGKVYVVHLRRDRAGTGYIGISLERLSGQGFSVAA